MEGPLDGAWSFRSIVRTVAIGTLPITAGKANMTSKTIPTPSPPAAPGASPRARPPHSPLRAALVGIALAGLAGCSSNDDQVAEGKQTFRFETFGDETKWTDTLRMQEVVSAVDPTTAL